MKTPISALFSIVLAMLLMALPMMVCFAQTSLDTRTISAIDIRLNNLHPQQFDFALPLPQMAGRIKNNLAQWHYPMRMAANQPTSSHTLVIEIGLISNGKTPVGFSFVTGNSDPRAVGFQKADVLPVTCRLMGNGDGSQAVEKSQDFNAAELQGNATQTTIIEQLIDDMSTVCYELLEDLDWSQSSVHTTLEPAPSVWLPKVRVETITEPTTTVPATAKPKIRSETVDDSESVNDSESVDNSEARKQIIIHNQGSPLILQMGHERR